MVLAVVTKASGGLPITWVSAAPYALPITEAPNGRGIAVTQVASGGLPATYVTEGGAIVLPTPPFATFDPATASSTTLSNGNLTATHNATTANTGVKGKPFQSTGKYYFEVKLDARTGGSAIGVGLIDSTGTYANVVVNTTHCTVVYTNSGNISSNDTSSGKNISGTAVGDIIGVAVDLDVRKAWLRENAGLWDATAGDNPATGIGGVTVGAGSFAPVVAWALGTAGDAMTANFGATAYANAAPSGFGNWPAS